MTDLEQRCDALVREVLEQEPHNMNDCYPGYEGAVCTCDRELRLAARLGRMMAERETALDDLRDAINTYVAWARGERHDGVDVWRELVAVVHRVDALRAAAEERDRAS